MAILWKRGHATLFSTMKNDNIDILSQKCAFKLEQIQKKQGKYRMCRKQSTLKKFVFTSKGQALFRNMKIFLSQLEKF